MLFRPMVASDYEGLVRLFVPLSQEDREAFRVEITPEVIRGWIDHLDYTRLLPIVAEINHEIIGDGTLRFGKGAYRHTAEVRIYLSRAWRRAGIGTQLLQTLIDLGRRQGLHFLRAEIIASHLESIKAFAGQGFEVIATLEDHFMLPDGRTLDEVLMFKRLVSRSNEF